MNKKIVTLLSVGFSIFFLLFVFRLTDQISNSQENLLNSPNIVDVTDQISTRVLIATKDFVSNNFWIQKDFDDSSWTKFKIPQDRILQINGFQEGAFALYRIRIPKEVFKKLSHLQNESSISLYAVYFNRFDISINGRFHLTNRPVDALESIVILPVPENQDTVIALKGYIKPGDTGIDHRDRILIGKSSELLELHRANYKGTIFQLIFILCKGSILFIFALIYLLVKVDKSFEKFLIFGSCTVVEELIAGDYFLGPLNFNQMVYLYNFVNIGAVLSVFLFFGELLGPEKKPRLFNLLSAILILISVMIMLDAIYLNAVFDITKFLKFWNLVMVCVMVFYIQKAFKFDRVLFIVLLSSVCLCLWSALFSSNVGFNLKAYGNLLLFFAVAYQTFVIFRREQDHLLVQEKQLLEQEKDVAIGKTASLLAHDVRKPFEQMKLVLEKVAAGNADRSFLEVANEDISLSIENIDRQVNEIMNFSKTRSLVLSDISFYQVLSHSLKQVMSINQNVNLKLEYQFENNSKIFGDKTSLSGALTNLISNAVEAIRDIGQKKEGLLRFKTYRDGQDFVFEIFNDGPLIPIDALDNIFKPLFTFGKVNGTGLGLSSVVKTINDHKGSINVQNINNQGVQFSLRFKNSSSEDDYNYDSFKPSSNSYSYNFVNEQTKNNATLRVFILYKNDSFLDHFKSTITSLLYSSTFKITKNVKEGEEDVNESRFDLYVVEDDLHFCNQHLGYFSKELIHVGIYNKKDFQSTDLNLFEQIPSSEQIKKIVDTAYASRIKILLVDDTKLIRIAWQIYHGDHNILCLSTPEEALRLLDTNKNFSAFVLDYHFDNSSMNGEELAKRILKIKSDTKIFISSSVDQQLPEFKSISKREFDIRKLLK